MLKISASCFAFTSGWTCRAAVLGSVAIITSAFGLSQKAGADRIAKSALGFQTLGCSDLGQEVSGLRSIACGDLLVGLKLPDGNDVCGFGINFFDGDPTNDITATLYRKRVTPGSDPFAPPQQMARVKSNGSSSVLREKVTTNIKRQTVDNDRFSYFAKISSPANSSTLLGQAIVDTQAFATCP